MSHYVIEKLQRGEEVIHKEAGNSMTPILKSRQPVRLKAVDPKTLKINDIVFCRVKGSTFTHKIYAIKKQKGKLKFQIGNNKKHINGWTSQDRIYGKVIEIL